jgi:type I restriction enzyme S subunit
MEVKKGYKQTEVGVIPDDWEVTTIGTVCETSSGTTPSRALMERYYKNGTVPWVKTLDLNNSDIYATEENVTETALRETCLRLYPMGTVLVAMYGGFNQIGRTGLLRVLATVNQAITAIHPNKSSPVPEYLLLNFNYRVGYWKSVASSSRKDPNITSKDIRDFPIACPKPREQETIAEVLRDADALIEFLERLIAKKRNIKQAAMQQLLTGKKLLPGFSGKWEVKKLGKIGEITGAGVDKKIRPDEITIRLVNYLDVYHRGFIYGKHLNHYVTARPEQIQRCAVKKGDIFFTPSSEMPYDIGVSAVAMEDIPDAVYSYHVDRLRLYEDWDLAFRAYIFKTRYFFKQAERFCEGSGKRYVINLTTFRELLDVYYPIDKEEQTAIAQILSDMDAEIEALEQKLDKYKMIKQGMMQELLIGRIRLIQQKEVGAPMTAAMKASKVTSALPKRGHNWQINEAVVIAALTSRFGSEEYPLGRKRYTKFSYLLHRHVEGKAEGYRKKAAGPYNPDTKYKGPEKIAQNNRYIKHHTSGKLSGFIVDENIEQAREYFDKWYGPEALKWLEQFRYESNEQLESLTTMDMAVCNLMETEQAVSVAGIRDVIRNHPEWKAKLNRPIFSDKNIAAAIKKSQELLGV